MHLAARSTSVKKATEGTGWDIWWVYSIHAKALHV